ncbi:MAG: ACP phosphodiesterase [Prolixibacteraceae bacterium]
MNYLGHIFLSGTNEQLLVGNFIGDYVKGKQYENYPPEIRKGIILHRFIDEFTDSNSHWMKIRELLRPLYGRYSGVVADVLADHFLAANWSHFSSEQLSWYSKWVYAIFLRNFDVMPKRVQNFLPFLIQHRRLQSYAQLSGLKMTLRIMAHYTSLPEASDLAMKLIRGNYAEFQQHSILFLDEAVQFAIEKRISI